MKKVFILIIFLASICEVSAQTRRIGHRSHGGSVYTKGDHSDGNYGDPYMPPYRIIHRTDTIHMESGKDSVVILKDTMIIQLDTLHHLNMMELPMNDVDQMGRICTKMTSRSHP